MYKHVFYGLLGALILALPSCKKKKEGTPTAGIYRGVFSRIMPSGDTSGVSIVFLSLHGTNNTFTLQGDTITGFPYPCSGDFVVLDEERMIFESYGGINKDTMQDRHYILDTIYTYEFLDSTFKLYTTTGSDTVYDYNLHRF